MYKYIYQENGKYYIEMVDLIGTSILKQEITKEEYDSYH